MYISNLLSQYTGHRPNHQQSVSRFIHKPNIHTILLFIYVNRLCSDTQCYINTLIIIINWYDIGNYNKSCQDNCTFYVKAASAKCYYEPFILRQMTILCLFHFTLRLLIIRSKQPATSLFNVLNCSYSTEWNDFFQPK